ncbi:CRISPR-associated helicase/endonuclease Cas3 [Salisediminibacterium halotolerans]|uniref:CRISPR-associated endonuclease/helicase Cas3 n=1 Tax=Salisediminibacterium halotolerans TaxID=517425 RepID=A0A1H9T7K7_9BACI|nr:CRISPR-associated helicase/endonuclease Cas3 [Salisediminibacterium haloalkalitolerans]SER92709.1 CRISPR-associated endonuclease/helicase Cas3 [Salisediminibacterium haloalkalitolerans]
MSHIAHVREMDERPQMVKDHLLDAKKLAELYGEKFGMKYVSGLAGLLHDLGKYSNDFQNYLKQALEHPDNPPTRGTVDHSTAGGKLLFEVLHEQREKDLFAVLTAEIAGNAIISHHSYIHDYIDPNLETPYIKRVKEKELSEYQLCKKKFFEEVMSEKEFNQYCMFAKKELEEQFQKIDKMKYAELGTFLNKCVFSALIDADRTNTREFEEDCLGESLISKPDIMKVFYDRLMEKIQSFSIGENVQSHINQLRSQMSEECDKAAEKPSGIYTLSIPTGGGKTLASLRYGLKHAINEKKDRIIYVVPFTTIIEQNAKDIRQTLKNDDLILEHHSNMMTDDSEEEDDDWHAKSKRKLALAKDNWDSPIIFTTMVQYLNAFYDYGSSNARRIHNLSNSIIVFDEVQKVPTHCLSLFNMSLNYLSQFGSSSIVLCTATQPALNFVQENLNISSDAEMISNLNEVTAAFKRVNLIDDATKSQIDTIQLSDKCLNILEEENNLLVILNTKSAVRKLFEQLKEHISNDVSIYHLSTSMCAAHRKDILENIHDDIKNGNKIICVSSQLIEAGVDVDFNCVIRSLTGLDSIAQAAGRCNRNGKLATKPVYMIDHVEENLDKLQEIAAGKEITRKMLIDMKNDPELFNGDLLNQDAITHYFKMFYKNQEHKMNFHIPKLDKDMTELLTALGYQSTIFRAYKSKNNSLPITAMSTSIRTASKNFAVIDQPTTSVLVPYKEGQDYITQLNSQLKIEDISQLFKKIQHYSVQLYKHELDKIIENEGAIHYIDGEVLVLKEPFYSYESGVDIEGTGGLSDLMI